MIKGWTKMAEGSWRHDGYKTAHNKLNIYEKKNKEIPEKGSIEEVLGEHIADMEKGRRAEDGYVVVYTDNEDVLNGTGVISKILDRAGNKDAAKKKATEIMRNNPASPPE